jgi:hypothetical protein
VSGQGDLYYVSARAINTRRFSGPPRVLYESTETHRTECRRSSGCVTVNTFNENTINPTFNPGPYCVIGYGVPVYTSWPFPFYQCGPGAPGYACDGSGAFTSEGVSVFGSSLTDSGTSSLAEGRNYTLSVRASCNGTSSCCCGGRCYDNVVSGCPGPVYFPGLACGFQPVPCLPRQPYGACCVYGGCLDGLTPSQCSTIGGSFSVRKRCAQVECGQQPGSCCYPDGSCQDTLEQQCLSTDGVWNGPGTRCDTTTCPVIPIGACCTPIGCVGGLTLSQCLAGGGTGWFQGQPCTPVLCGGGGGPGACCSLGGGGRRLCTIENDRAACEALNGGIWLGSGTTCDPDPCDQIQTNPFNPFTAQGMAREAIRIYQAGDVPHPGCASCGGDSRRPVT